MKDLLSKEHQWKALPPPPPPRGGKANAEQKLATKAKNQSKGAGIWVSHLSHSGIQVKLSKAVWDLQRSSPGLSVLQKKAY